MASEYNNFNPSYEKCFVAAQTADHMNPRKEINPLPNPIYKHPLHYYDSQVKKSHMYPNIWHIKPVDYDYRPSNVGGMITKSIEDNKKFVLGGYVLPKQEYNYKS